MTTISIDDKTLNALLPKEELLEEYKKPLLKLLHDCYDKGVYGVALSLRGRGDDGWVNDVTLGYKDGGYYCPTGEENSLLQNYVWELSRATILGFETDDGGGLDVEIYISEEGTVTAAINGWFNVVTEEPQYTFESK